MLNVAAAALLGVSLGAMLAGGVILVLASAAAIVALGAKSPSRPYFLFLQRANAGFADPAARVDAVAAELARYAALQWLRIGFGAVAFAASLLAIYGRAL